MQVNAFAALISVLISAILGFGLSILAERRFRHLYSTSMQIIRYLNFFAFFLIGLGLTKIFVEISQLVMHGYPISGEVIYGTLLVYATTPLAIFIATFGISVLSKNLNYFNHSESIVAHKKNKNNNSMATQPEEVLSRVTNQLIVAALIIGAAVFIFLNFTNLFNFFNNPTQPQNSSNVESGDRAISSTYNNSGGEKFQEAKWIMSNKNNFLSYIDIGNIKRKSKGGTVWMVFQSRDIESDKSIFKVQFEIDCENRISRGIAGGTSYKSLNVSEFHSIPLEKWNSSPWVLLDSNEPNQQQMFNFVCNK